MIKAKKDTKYTIVQNTDITAHCAQCNLLLDQGFIPLGGPCVTESTRQGSVLIITQAFIKETKKEKQ